MLQAVASTCRWQCLLVAVCYTFTATESQQRHRRAMGLVFKRYAAPSILASVITKLNRQTSVIPRDDLKRFKIPVTVMVVDNNDDTLGAAKEIVS